MSKGFEAYRVAKQKGEGDAFLDRLGRPKAAEAAPDYVKFNNELADRLAPAHSNAQSEFRKKVRHGKVDPNAQLGFWPKGLNPSELIKRMRHETYMVGGLEYTRDQLLERMDVAAQLADLRRREGEELQRLEDVTRLEREYAFQDAEILDEIVEKSDAFSKAAE
jgi:hypothetical protein